MDDETKKKSPSAAKYAIWFGVIGGAIGIVLGGFTETEVGPLLAFGVWFAAGGVLVGLALYFVVCVLLGLRNAA